MVHVPKPIKGWRPSTPAVTSATWSRVLEEHRVVVVHFWAEWNGWDPVADERLHAVRDVFGERVYFCSCDTGPVENWEFCKASGVLNVPWVAVYGDGRLCGSSLKYSMPEALTELLHGILEAAA